MSLISALVINFFNIIRFRVEKVLGDKGRGQVGAEVKEITMQGFRVERARETGILAWKRLLYLHHITYLCNDSVKENSIKE